MASDGLQSLGQFFEPRFDSPNVHAHDEPSLLYGRRDLLQRFFTF